MSRAACLAQQGWASLSHPIQDPRPPFDPDTGLCTKAFNAFEVKALLSLCVWGLAHTKESRILPFYVYMMDFVFIDPKSLHKICRLQRDLESLSSLSLCQKGAQIIPD